MRESLVGNSGVNRKYLNTFNCFNSFLFRGFNFRTADIKLGKDLSRRSSVPVQALKSPFFNFHLVPL
jgi:hypothetical protein